MKTLKFMGTVELILSLTILFPEVIHAGDFAVDLYKQAARSKRNVVISPLGTKYAFSIAFLGARDQTAMELSRVFGFSQDTSGADSSLSSSIRSIQAISEKGEVDLIAAAALWPSKSIKMDSTFVSRSRTTLGIDINQLDYNRPEVACRNVNSWASAATKGKFNSVISPSDFSPLTNIIVTSAVYFKGKWKYPFPKSSTTFLPFKLGKNEQIEVNTMHQKSYFGYGENDSIQVLDLSYVDENLSMVIVLPRAIDGLFDIEKSNMIDSIIGWSNGLRTAKVEVFIPRFKFSSRTDLKQNLISMGIKTAFDFRKADFSGISRRQDSLFVEKVLQKAMIEVNEEGTEASAIDAILMGVGGLGAPPPCPVFRADHPFLFVIKEKRTGTILFIGKVMNPLKG